MRFAALCLLIAAIMLSGCGAGGEKFPSETRTVFGLPVTVTVFISDAKPDEVQGAFDAVFNTLKWYEGAAYTSGKDNQLERIASGAGRESVPVDTAVYNLIMRGLQLNDMTGEAFDLRYGPLLDAWLATGKPSKPAQADLDSALALIKTGGMFVAGKSILLSKPEMRFDARGLVEAWAIDRAAERLVEKGLSAFEIRTPYAIRVVGMPQNSQFRTFNIADPVSGDSTWATLQIGQGGLAFLPAVGQGGRLVLDPRTGEESKGAAIVAAKDCATAFGLAYALNVDGDLTKLTDKGKAELMGHIRISGSRPSYSIAAEGVLKDKLSTRN